MTDQIQIIKRSMIDPDQHISAHFAWKEFMCKCGKCEEQRLHPDLFPMIEKVREQLGGYPLRINSGYRCPSHNAHVMGSKGSKHMQGIAVDLSTQHASNIMLGRAALDVGFRGIKVYANWVHCDIREGTPWLVGV